MTDILTFLGAGWNLGNSFDSCDGNPYNPEHELDYVTRFHNPAPDRELFEAVKNAGFTTLRLPVSWHNHLTDDDYHISDKFLEYYKNFVDIALEIGFKVIINIHHDNSTFHIYPDSEHLESSWRFMKAVWDRLCDTFGDYDERLLFEAYNEPRLLRTEHEWAHFVHDNPVQMDALHTIMELNQRFVNLVRESGRENDNFNRSRYLIVPSHAASPENAIISEFSMPTDTIKDRLILSVHAYTPYLFALAPQTLTGAVSTFDDKNPADTMHIDKFMDGLAKKFPDTPVVIGEFGASNRDDNTADRVRYSKYYTAKARSHGFPCIWWDNGVSHGDFENFGLFDRKTKQIKYLEIVKALVNE